MIAGAFQIQSQFNITGRGLVVTGQILEGRIKIGNKLTFTVDGKPITLEISAVEMGDKISTKEYFVGLMFNYDGEQQKEYLEKIKILEQTATVSY